VAFNRHYFEQLAPPATDTTGSGTRGLPALQRSTSDRGRCPSLAFGLKRRGG
jgi:hypothetical protein